MSRRTRVVPPSIPPALVACIAGGIASCMAACASGGPAAEPGLEGRIRALSTRQASLGGVIDLYAEGLPPPEDGRLTVIFEGEYRRLDGVVESVALDVPVRRVDRGTLRWGGFGPHAIPFTATGDRLGTFVGTVRPRLVTHEGEVLETEEATEVQLEVGPSIRVRKLEPQGASCARPALRALGGLPYRIEVEALGFEPTSFTYTIEAPALGVSDSVRHLATAPVDVLGDDGSLVLPHVPEGTLAYGLVVSVQARARDGSTHQTLFAIGVHRPMEVFYDGNVELAEVYAPVPVSGCMPGGDIGQEVSYTETQSETRQRSYAVHWDESWLRSHTVSRSESTTDTRSRSNTVGFSTTNGQSFEWSVGTEASGSVGIEGIVEVGMKVNGSVGGSRFRSATRSNSRTDTVSHSETTTDTESTTEAMGGSNGEAFSWEVSSTEQLARGLTGRVVAGTYGVFYRQTLRLSRRAALVTYNLCGLGDVVGDIELEDWTWSADLGLAGRCPPLPESNLPEARCVLPPCSGE